MNPREASTVTLSSGQAFSVVIIYDEFRSGQQAVQTYQRLMLERGEPAEVQVKTWTFDLLRNRQLNKAAVEDAAEAEVIILAAASQEVPPQIETWFEGWRAQSDNGPASVVAISDSAAKEDPHLSPIENYLRRIASSTGCNLLIEKTDELTSGVVYR